MPSRSSLFALVLLVSTASARRAVSFDYLVTATEQYVNNIASVFGLEHGRHLEADAATGDNATAGGLSFAPGIFVLTGNPPSATELWHCIAAPNGTHMAGATEDLYVCSAIQNGQPTGTPLVEPTSDPNCIFKYRGAGMEFVSIFANQDATNNFWHCMDAGSTGPPEYGYVCFSNGTLIEQPKQASNCIVTESSSTIT